VLRATHPYPRARSTALTALLAALLLAGCTGPGTTPTGSPTPSDGTATATSSAAPTGSASVPATPSTPPEPKPTSDPAPPATEAPVPGVATVDVVVTFSGWNATTAAIEVGGYATTVESGGTCELTLRGPAGATASVQVAANPDASTTSCELASVPAGSLGSGTWSGTLTYRSDRSAGTTAVSPIEVP